MMKKLLLFTIVVFTGINLMAQANFSTSLHATRNGKSYAYKAENGGMELITGIPMDDLTCKKCHSTTGHYPNGDTIDPASYAPSCADCHDFTQGNTVEEQTCLNCHNRQVYERAAYPDVDVHRASGMTCINCHSKKELHGDDGVAYNSLNEEGAIQVECEDCHTDLESNTSHDTHADAVECAACHAAGILTCASCHFETLLATGKSRAINKISHYRLLVKKSNGKIGLGAFMTHTYDGKTNVIINAYHSHAITKNATTCEDCHYNMGANNVAIKEYNETGTMTMTTWNSETKKIMGPSGVVPLTADWKTAMKFDFATYTGDPNVFPSDPEAWEYLKSEVDNGHLYFAEPLDNSTLAKLGFTNFAGIDELGQFSLLQNYPNPFNNFTRISYSLKKNASVSLKIYSASGKLIKVIEEGNKNTGDHEVEVNASDLPVGILFCSLDVNGQTYVRKLIHSN